MPYTIKVAVIHGDAGEKKKILDTLSAIEDILIVGDEDSADRGLQLIKDMHPDVTIAGSIVRGGDGFKFCENIMAWDPLHPVILITHNKEEDIYRRALRAGVKEVLQAPADRISLSDAIYRAYDLNTRHRSTVVNLKKETEIRGKSAKIVSVFSTKGGVGKTTISTNLAVALKQLGGKVAIIDLDVYSGDVALALDIVPKRNLSDLVSDIGKLDLDLLESYMFRHSSGVMVMPAPMKMEYADFVAPEHISKILKVMIREYDYIVVDCASYMHDPVLVALDVSDAILLVTTMDIFAIKNLRSCMASLEASNYSRAKFRLVVNRASRESGISEQDIEATLGLQPVITLQQEDQILLRSINQGMPAVLSYRNSRFAKGITELARKLAGEQQVKREKPEQAKAREKNAVS